MYKDIPNSCRVGPNSNRTIESSNLLQGNTAKESTSRHPSAWLVPKNVLKTQSKFFYDVREQRVLYLNLK